MSRAALPLVRLVSIRITVDPSWIFIFVLVTWSLAGGYLPQELPGASPLVVWLVAAGTSLALFGSVIAHEIAHALVARARQVEVDEIMLFLFGGVARLRGEPRDPLSEFLIAAAGPLLSLWLGVFLIVIVRGTATWLPPPLFAGLRWLGIINVGLAIFNLVPGFPLDGGRILRAIVWWWSGDFERGTVVAGRTGQVIAVLLVGLGVTMTLATGALSWLWEALIGMFLWGAAVRSVRYAQLRDAIEGLFVRDFLNPRVPAVRADHEVRVGFMQARAAGADQVAIVDADGRLVGVVKTRTLEEAARDRPTDLVEAYATDPLHEQRFEIDEPAAEILTRLALLEDEVTLVEEQGRLVGTIDAAALAEANPAQEPA